MSQQNAENNRKNVVLLRGGGDLATGVALRLQRTGIKLIITELPNPLVVRRLVAFGSALYTGEITIEGVKARKVLEPFQALDLLSTNQIPVISDPTGSIRNFPMIKVAALVDARMTKKPPDLGLEAAPLVIGLGPGFDAGRNCHAAIETNRGHNLGRVIWDGAPEANTGIPGKVGAHQSTRVLRAPQAGILESHCQIGDSVAAGNLIASVGEHAISAPFDGLIRGLIWSGLPVSKGMKIGDLDPRNDPTLATTISDKALAIGGGVLEALLTDPNIRKNLWR